MLAQQHERDYHRCRRHNGQNCGNDLPKPLSYYRPAFSSLIRFFRFPSGLDAFTGTATRFRYCNTTLGENLANCFECIGNPFIGIMLYPNLQELTRLTARE